VTPSTSPSHCAVVCMLMRTSVRALCISDRTTLLRFHRFRFEDGVLAGGGLVSRLTRCPNLPFFPTAVGRLQLCPNCVGWFCIVSKAAAGTCLCRRTPAHVSKRNESLKPFLHSTQLIDRVDAMIVGHSPSSRYSAFLTARAGAGVSSTGRRAPADPAAAGVRRGRLACGGDCAACE
jgi:hypothetical protein